MLNKLLIFIPIAIALEYFAPQQHLWIFLASALAILPLAGWMSEATENIAEKTGEGIGGLLNATFGNAAELIIAFAALRAGMHDVVKASIAGSIVGNILLVLGAAMFAGGLRHFEQAYNAAAARSEATLLMLAAIAMILPAAYNRLIEPTLPGNIGALSISIAVVLLVVYLLFLVFSLITHNKLFKGTAELETDTSKTTWPIKKSVLILAASTVVIAWVSEILVSAIEPAGHALGLSPVFMGLFVVAILGNAAEHAAAITVAMKNRMDLSLSIAIGSSVQVALFVAPVLTIASLWVGPHPMDMVFTSGMVLMILLSVMITAQVAGDGRSDWLRGIQLMAVYIIFALAFFFVPTAPTP